MTPRLEHISGREPEGRAPAEEPQALSANVSLHVRSLFAAAERSAAAIRAEAEQRAALTRAEAEAESQRVLDEARGDADELLAARRRHLAELSDAIVRAAESALGDLELAGEARSALDGLVRSLRDTAERIVPPGVSTAGRGTPDTGAPLAGAPDADLPVAKAPDADAPATGAPAEASAPVAEAPLDGNGNGDAPPDAAPGLTGARLVAFQMAQAGSTRGEVAAHLRRTFAMQDAHEVLNDVFPAAGSTRHG